MWLILYVKSKTIAHMYTHVGHKIARICLHERYQSPLYRLCSAINFMMFVPSIENCFLSSFSVTQMAWIQCKNGVHARIGNINTIQNVSIFMAITFALNIKIHCHRLTGNILLSILCALRVACNISIPADGDDDDNDVKSHTHELKTRDCNSNVAANRGIQFILTFFSLFS